MPRVATAAMNSILIAKEVKNPSWFNLILFILASATVFAVVWVKTKTASEFGRDPLLFVYTVFVTVFQLSRIVAAHIFSKSGKYIENSLTSNQANDEYFPSVTFVVPCKNEEKSIAKTVEKCFAADYPKSLLEVIIINDGSTDNTIEVLRESQKAYPNLVVVDWKVNQGKRMAMAEGFRRARGEIIVQLDSDSYIEPETFYQFISPFRHPEIGAVCAHADPDNADQNFLTKIQAAYYFLSFRILKAAESTFMTVFCCSGCSSAYRKNIVLPILDQWLGERFLGKPVSWGDDRALTNWVLRKGYKTIYTDTVLAKTIVPDNLRQLLKQQVRWKKGWFVNSIFASGFVLKQYPFVALTYFFPLIFITIATPVMATKALIYNPIVKGIVPYYYILGVYLVSVAIVLYYRFVSRENKYWPYVFIWSTLNMFVLSFIFYYAMISIQNRKWGTR
ncbi:MAG: glycosyltransferase [Candidatus Doudnabacteria bacterium]|nr:glycosyltransferase [Candidatus Doudnabacteria bacterium]